MSPMYSTFLLKITSLGIMLSYSTIIFSQHLSAGIKLNNPAWNYLAVETKMDKEYNDSDKKDLFNKGKWWYGDTLQYQTYYMETSIIHRYKFERPKGRLTGSSMCIYQEYRTACDRCGDKLENRLISGKKYGFRLMPDGSYLSKIKYRTKLVITNADEEESCLRLIFLPMVITDEEYDDLYKSIKN